MWKILAVAGTLVFGAFSGAAAEPPDESVRQHAVEIIETADPLLPIFAPAEEDCTVNLLLCGEVLRSTLTSRDCAVESNGTFFDLWFFPGRQGEAVGVAASSPQFATLIALFTPSNTVWDFDVAPVGGIASLGAIISRRGIWAISVGSTTAAPTRTGDYTMALVCGGYPCRPDSTTLCLGGGRYRVQVGYENQFANRFGFAGALPVARSSQSGYFYFGTDPSNIELLLKILDFGDSVKVFWGQLTNLKYKIVITDLLRGTSKTYLNPANNCGGSDTNAFQPRVAASTTRAASCRPDRNTACLLKGRFQIRGTWRNQYNGTSGTISATRVSDLTSAFYFSSPGNIELLVKLVDLGDRITLFYGALSDLEYSITVLDTLTGTQKTYNNPASRYCGGQDDFIK